MRAEEAKAKEEARRRAHELADARRCEAALQILLPKPKFLSQMYPLYRRNMALCNGCPNVTFGLVYSFLGRISTNPVLLWLGGGMSPDLHLPIH